ncbi:receptor-like protein EIX2 [Pyrus communis]|uniref:receptor-like protein EIX2 n=1 Tax=Pyrus communis TaxID=23211 RepID=UPI0035C0E7AA
MFKQDLKDPSNRLSSWTSEGDCCNWSGVVCDSFTGHVRELHLNNPNPYVSVPFLFILNYKGLTWLGGTINPSLLYLKHLNYLDLRYKNFQGNQIPSFFGPLKSLRYLNLSQAGFQGMIPPQLGNLSNLRVLGLSDYMLKAENLERVSGISHLQNQDMSFTNLSKPANWLNEINMLPSLLELRMEACILSPVPPPTIINFTSLSILDLSLTRNLMPSWAFNLTNVVSLYLRDSGLQGTVSTCPPDLSLDNLCKLIDLDLSSNSLHGNVSEIFESLSVCSSYRIVIVVGK